MPRRVVPAVVAALLAAIAIVWRLRRKRLPDSVTGGTWEPL